MSRDPHTARDLEIPESWIAVGIATPSNVQTAINRLEGERLHNEHVRYHLWRQFLTSEQGKETDSSDLMKAIIDECDPILCRACVTDLIYERVLTEAERQELHSGMQQRHPDIVESKHYKAMLELAKFINQWERVNCRGDLFKYLKVNGLSKIEEWLLKHATGMTRDQLYYLAHHGSSKRIKRLAKEQLLESEI